MFARIVPYVCSGQLSLQPSAGCKMSSSSRTMAWSLVWLIGVVVCLLVAACGLNCSLTQTTDGRIVRCGIISACRSAVTSKIRKHFWSHKYDSHRQCYSKYLTFKFTFALPKLVTRKNSIKWDLVIDGNW